MENENLETNEKLEQIEASALEGMEEVTPLAETNEDLEINDKPQEEILEMSSCQCTGGCGNSYNSTNGCQCTGGCGSNYHH